MATFKIGKVVLKSLFKKPATKITADQPIITKNWKARTRGHIDIDKDQCILCGMCMRKCPANAITVDRAGSTWEIQRMQCIQCGSCVEVCPKKCLSMAPEYTEPGVEKVVDKFDIPKKEKPAPKAAPAAAAAPAGDGPEGVALDTSTCIVCGLCAKNCPVGAITVDRKERTWSIDRDACVQCGLCVEKCPKNSLSMGPTAGDSFTIPKAEKKAAPAKEEAPVKEEAPAEAPAEEAAPAAAPAADGPDGITINMDDCVLCGLCAKNCPVEAITVDRKETKSWAIDRDACIECQACVGACPKNALDFGPTSGDRFVKA